MDLAQLLANAGIVVFEARNADEALEVLSTRTDVRMTITDVDMGDGSQNGFQLAKTIAARWPEVGLLIVSGQSHPKVSDLPEGARFLTKPCDPNLLTGNVFAFVSQKSGSI
ncbi:response regulator [Methylobacterium mesophilicum SR1.6/6]|uniref:Response regulator n=2 Tax=Methylobacterium mesophilicum TaxID=39956 RepID=A0A6B9FV76_9HYPH|nr:response regulator [Methylobacterium mesophilicum SR1.6/6]